MGFARTLQVQLLMPLTARLAHQATWVLVFHLNQLGGPHLENHEAVHPSKTVQGMYVTSLPKNLP